MKKYREEWPLKQAHCMKSPFSSCSTHFLTTLSGWMAPRGERKPIAFPQAAKREMSAQTYPDVHREITMAYILHSVIAEASHGGNKALNLCRKTDGIGCNKYDKWHGGSWRVTAQWMAASSSWFKYLIFFKSELSPLTGERIRHAQRVKSKKTNRHQQAL